MVRLRIRRNVLLRRFFGVSAALRTYGRCHITESPHDRVSGGRRLCTGITKSPCHVETPAPQIGIFKWIYLSNRGSDLLPVLFKGRVFAVGGSNGHVTDDGM